MSDTPPVGRRFTEDQIISRVYGELMRAVMLHGPMHSYHEGHSVIEEEFEELWDEIKVKRPDNAKLVEEAIQLAAMACRFVYDLCEAP